MQMGTFTWVFPTFFKKKLQKHLVVSRIIRTFAIANQ